MISSQIVHLIQRVIYLHLQIIFKLIHEIIDLKCNSALRSQFFSLSPLPTAADITTLRRLVPRHKFKQLDQFAQRYLCRFDSMHRCEQSLSAMKLIKHRNRSRLTGLNLGSMMILAVTKWIPYIDKLSYAGKCHMHIHKL